MQVASMVNLTSGPAPKSLSARPGGSGPAQGESESLAGVQPNRAAQPGQDSSPPPASAEDARGDAANEARPSQTPDPAANQAEKQPADESFADIVARLLESQEDALAPDQAAPSQSPPLKQTEQAASPSSAAAINLDAAAAWVAPQASPVVAAAIPEMSEAATASATSPNVNAPLPVDVTTPMFRVTMPAQAIVAAQTSQAVRGGPEAQAAGAAGSAPVPTALPQEAVAASTPAASAANPAPAGVPASTTLEASQGSGPMEAAQPSPAGTGEVSSQVVRAKPAGSDAEGASRGPARAGISAFQQALAAAGARATSSSSGEGSSQAAAWSVAGQIASPASQASTSAGPAQVQSAAAASDGTQVVDQIASRLSSVGAGEGRQVTIELNPPELGKVQATFQSDGGGVRCLVVVSNPQTLDLVHHEKAALIERLADSGVQLKQIEISLGHSSSSGSFGSGSGPAQDGSFARQWGGQGGTGQSPSHRQDWQGNGEPGGAGGSGSAAANSLWRPAPVEAGRLNVWM